MYLCYGKLYEASIHVYISTLPRYLFYGKLYEVPKNVYLFYQGIYSTESYYTYEAPRYLLPL